MTIYYEITEYGTTVDWANDRAEAERKLALAKRINPAAREHIEIVEQEKDET